MMGTIGSSWLWGSGGRCMQLTAVPLPSGLELPSPPAPQLSPAPHAGLQLPFLLEAEGSLTCPREGGGCALGS